MITRTERERLGEKLLIAKPPSNFAGFDCYGNHINIGDTVEVVIDDPIRARSPKYQYCGFGKKGKVIGLFNETSWIIHVEFTKDNGEKETVGCVDYYLFKTNKIS